MRKTLIVLGLALILAALFAGTALAAPYGYTDAAPESGDGIPNGSGFDVDAGIDASPGPAPNSGDGISDGSGF